MTTEILARIQFALTVGFHYIYPPMSIGLGVLLVLFEGLHLKTKDKFYEDITKFWTKIFALTFAVGVATGIVMEFEFGTNWATYSRFVGDVFGSPLAAEGVFAFFLESSFLAILLFGWNRVSPKMHFFSTVMVSLGSMLSALWIVVANSWQQTPAGFHLVGEGMMKRAEIVDFWAMVFNPSTFDRITHVLAGAWQTGAFMVISVAAWYLYKKIHTEHAKRMMKVAVVFAVFASLFQLGTGHGSAIGVAKNQPAKLAAMEAHYPEQAPGTLYLFGWVNDKQERVDFGIGLPGFLSFLVSGDLNKPLQGLKSFKPEDRPPVQFVFQTYHLMVAIGMLLIALSVGAAFLWWRGKLFDNRLALMALIPSVLLPELANQFGWYAAEVGRQPWIVYGLLRTSEALSKTVVSSQILFSIIMFGLIYTLLFGLFVFLLIKKIKAGPTQNEGSML